MVFKEFMGRKHNLKLRININKYSPRQASLACADDAKRLFKRFFEKSFAKMMFFMFAQKNQKAVFFGTPRPKKYLQLSLSAFCVNVGFSRMPRQSSPKMSTPPASGEPPSFIGLRLTPLSSFA
jgi:hypothetical protein